MNISVYVYQVTTEPNAWFSFKVKIFIEGEGTITIQSEINHPLNKNRNPYLRVLLKYLKPTLISYAISYWTW